MRNFSFLIGYLINTIQNSAGLFHWIVAYLSEKSLVTIHWSSNIWGDTQTIKCRHVNGYETRQYCGIVWYPHYFVMLSLIKSKTFIYNWWISIWDMKWWTSDILKWDKYFKYSWYLLIKAIRSLTWCHKILPTRYEYNKFWIQWKQLTVVQ